MRLRHWQVLNEVRAIENQLFLCAVNGCGTVGRVQSTGHSAVYDPWGTNLLEMDTVEGISSVDIDLTVVEDIRNKINIFRDRKPELYKL
ncbi:MAG: nitrilase-related carbon-nitrogen hydrolase, partial [Veillonella sp.]|nr:nitrilase-related carbon-nitrogen hydrolase [Veillonella sp.]